MRYAAECMARSGGSARYAVDAKRSAHGAAPLYSQQRTRDGADDVTSAASLRRAEMPQCYDAQLRDIRER